MMTSTHTTSRRAATALAASAKSRTGAAFRADVPERVESAPLDDSALVERCLGGDDAAWEALVARYERLVYSIPLRYRMGADAAADVFQSVWMRLLEHLPRLENRERLASWLITTTTRECWRVTNRARREVSVDEDADGDERRPIEAVDLRPLAEEEMLRLAEQQRVRQAVEALPERARALVELLYYAEERPSYEEIARRLGMPVASIGPTRARALEKLRKLLE